MAEETLLKNSLTGVVLQAPAYRINNAIITLGDTDDSGKGRHFKSRFIQPGLAGYPGQFGNALIKKENLDKFVRTLRNKPVTINHKDNIGDDDKVGEVLNVWYNPEDGWYWCDGIITDETAINLINDKNWSVSCSYDFTKYDDEGGTENNIPYDIEFLDGEFNHLAIVNNPRYEGANIVFNSKTFNVGNNNFNPNQKRNERGQWVKDDVLIQQKKDKLIPIEVKSEDIPQFATKDDLGNWFKSIFEDLGNITIDDTGIRIDLYGGNADREAFKRRFQQEPNKAVAKAFEEVVTKSIKVDERQKDERHKHNQDIYYNKLKLDKDNYDVNLFIDYLEPNREYRYAGHSTTKIDNEISTRDTQVINHIMLTKVDNSIVNDLIVNFNPNVKEHEVNNDKEQDMALLEELKKLITKVENDKGENMDEKEKVDNEKVDKRKLIDEVGGILKGKVDDEIIRTIIGKMEKASYDDSEASADNKKVKNEAEEDEKKADNKKVKNESEEDKEKVKELKKDEKEDVENRCKNSVDNAKEDYFEKMRKIYNSAIEPSKEEKEYTSRADRLKAAEEYFKV